MFHELTLDSMPGRLPGTALTPVVAVHIGGRSCFRGDANSPSPGRGLAKNASTLVRCALCLHGTPSGLD